MAPRTNKTEPLNTLKQEADDPATSVSAPLAECKAAGFSAGLWAALKEKGDGNAASGVAAALDGFIEEHGDNSAPAAESACQFLDARAGDKPASPVPESSRPAAEHVADAGLPVKVSRTAAQRDAVPQASGRLSGHVSPVQSLRSTGSGLRGSRVPSPDVGEWQMPVAQSPSSKLAGVSPSQMTMRAIDAMSTDQDSQIADLEEQTAGIQSYTRHPAPPSSIATQVHTLLSLNLSLLLLHSPTQCTLCTRHFLQSHRLLLCTY